MPFNGSGTYSLPPGSIVADGTTADAADLNTPLQDIESSLSETLLRDGSVAWEADFDAGGFNLTNMGLPDGRTQAARVLDTMTTAFAQAATVGGTANAITLVFAPTFAAYTTGMMIRWVSGGVNTSTVTVAVDGLAAKALNKLANVALDAGDTGASGHVCLAVYDGTRFLLINPATAALTSQSNTFNATQIIRSTDAGAAAGPTLRLYRDSASPANDDIIGEFEFAGNDSGGNLTAFARLLATITDVTNGSEDGRLSLRTMIAGTMTTVTLFDKGVYSPNASGGDKGIDTINFLDYYVNGVLMPRRKVKGSNETLSADTTLQADDELLFAMDANGVYKFELEFWYNTPAAADFKFDLDSTAASPPTLTLLAIDYCAPGAIARISAVHEVLGTDVSITGGAGVGHVIVRGRVANDSAAGNFRLRWAQNTSDGGNTTVYRGSTIEYQAV